MEKKPLIILSGPTGVGKTELSIKLAEKINASIISADSIQIYKYMDIGSAKITKEEMKDIKHYLVDELDPRDEFNVFRFKSMADNAMDEIYKDGKIPMIVGGTGFYIQSVLYNIEFSNEDNDKSKEIRKKYELLAEEKGNEYVHNLLYDIDKESYDSIHKNNLKKVIRALEYYEMNHKKFSEHNKEQREKESEYNYIYFVLTRDKETMYENINLRVDKMIENGLEDEVRNLLNMGYERNLVSMQGLGYKEMVSYIDGKISYDEAIELIKKETRHFAKRQMTWFRREKDVTMISYEDYKNKEEMLDAMINIIKEKILKKE
ncbi:tRNA dimethylallyltransferase [Lachnospiraceae bacterium RM5]|nr:tRNA dimethylallyltransferase [Lachnospiraceae bacterium RM5]